MIVAVERHYPQDCATVWEELRSIARHVTWMADAVSITFDGDQREGVGTSFRCRTRVGPFVTTDVMVVTRWEPQRAMGVEHRGLVTGTGLFTLRGDERGTWLRWEETLALPWWLAGPLGARIAAPVLRALWRANLRRFAAALVA